jgi:hypothetical protein
MEVVAEFTQNSGAADARILGEFACVVVFATLSGRAAAACFRATIDIP